ncbi:MAG: triose-phosphate isomerase [Thermodesulfobacteriota bacterium]|nr:triose-phosphate isomerase [Thermodesulfobacteriota bacterium]
MRRPLIAGNWKLNQTLAESKELANQLASNLADIADRDIVIGPVFTALATVSEIIKNSPIQLAAQNCYPQTTGAFTGEVSPTLLQDVGCNYVIIGHSERRQLMGETDSFINQKLLKILEAELRPILCIGETLQERENNQMLEVLKRQVKGGLDNLTATQMADIVIAYEPIWAIGTGKTATNEQAQQAHSFIRDLVREIANQEVADRIQILYGGSVKPDNVDGLMAQDDIDGALVGGASLKAEDFIRIVRFED